jgi:SAM-dependent methyltransferase
MTGQGQDKYDPMPNLSPYMKKDRYETPKESFKQIAAKIKQNIKKDEQKELIDIGCANGEFLYYIKQNFSNWKLTGIDITPEFIKTGLEFKGLEGVDLKVKDLFDLRGEYDIVCSMGTFNVFREAEKVLDKFLEICRPGGIIVSDGLFNQYDVDSILLFCDNSKPESQGNWREGFNQHSQQRIKKHLKGKVSKVEFEDMIMGVEIPYDPGAPDINAFTFRDSAGKVMVTNGANILNNKTVMTIHK